MASKPSTPVVMRRAYPGENELTRIPILTNSPTPFRRSCSLSLRLRPTSFTNEFSVRQRNHHHQKQPAINKKTVLGNNIMDKQAGENMDLVDHSPQSKSESYKIQPKTANHCNGTVRKHSLSQHDRGMVSFCYVKIFICANYRPFCAMLINCVILGKYPKNYYNYYISVWSCALYPLLIPSGFKVKYQKYARYLRHYYIIIVFSDIFMI